MRVDMTHHTNEIVPFKSKDRKVKKSWIDYNGHMNVAYYTFAFDGAIDEFLEQALGIGPSFIREEKKGFYALQTQYRYLQELLLKDSFYISIFVADFTIKQMHLMLQMFDLPGKKTYATCETIMVNVDLQKRRSCRYSESLFKRISELYDASEQLRSSTSMGQPIGLRNKSYS